MAPYAYALHTFGRHRRFKLDKIDDGGIVLLLGEGETNARLEWDDCLEGIPDRLGRLAVEPSGHDPVFVPEVVNESPSSDRLKDRRRRLNERARAEYIAGAEHEWRKRTGWPMTAEELERVLPRYPRDV